MFYEIIEILLRNYFPLAPHADTSYGRRVRYSGGPEVGTPKKLRRDKSNVSHYGK